MKNLIKKFGTIKIYEENQGNRCYITATDNKTTESLVTYCVDTHNQNDNRASFFRNVAINYFLEIKDRFEKH